MREVTRCFVVYLTALAVASGSAVLAMILLAKAATDQNESKR
jgi:hypothetical protein